MAEAMQAHDPLVSQVMKQCVLDGELTKAADYFNLTSKMLEGDKLSLLRSTLTGYDANKISSIARLPFRSCVTTNFDKSIHDAIAAERKVAAVDYKYGDSSFKQAQWEDSLFVARIHGAAEVPSSIILSERQFSAVLEDENYQQFLRACFVHRNVLFLGFSFYDPAIRNVFEDLDRQFGAATPGRHMALLPDSSGAEFLQKASRLNIEVANYSDAENHKELWEAIDEFRASELRVPIVTGVIRPLGPAKRYLAACFARAKTRDKSRALKEALIEGIVSAMLQEAAPKALSRMELLEKVRVNLGLKKQASQNLVDSAVRSLVDARLCRKMKEKQVTMFAWQGDRSDGDSLDVAIGKLSQSLEQRALLQEKWRMEERLSKGLPMVFSHLVRTRGWDLGASFAAGRAPEPVSVESVIDECDLPLSTFDRERLLRVFLMMLQNPTEDEARILGELGRVSFALEMAFQTPQSTLLHSAILPHKIYFDASVLLPALVEGHPFSSVYSEAIDRLKEAAASAAVDMRLAVCTVYLNEMISHRRAAEALRREYGDGFDKMAKMDAIYHGPTNTNVYVGAYANFTHKNSSISFDDYLKRFAPYTSEFELKKWLLGRGFEVVDAIKTSRYSEVYGQLELEYANSLASGKKKPLLIEHDAIQLAKLDSDLGRGDRVLFVTADRQLREFVSRIGLSDVADGMVSNVGLVQFIELVLGGISESAGMTELLWNTKLSDKAMAVRSYFTNIALQMYEAGMAMAIPDIVESHSEQAAQEMAREGLDLDSEEPKGRAKAFLKLGSLEENYIKGMTEEVEKLRRRLD